MSDRPPPRRHASFTGRIGIARAEITPPVGIYARNWGAAKHDTAEGIHRPLTITALTISSAKQESPLVMIEADLGWWRPLTLFHEFQQRFTQELSLDASRLIVALAHTHAAAPLMHPDPSLPGNDLLATWHESVYAAAVKVVQQAWEASFEGVLDWHVGRCQLAANRDLPDPHQDRMICGYNPVISADDTLLIGRVTDREGSVRATLVNYACHPTTLAWDNRLISPDYVGAFRETMQKVTGAPALFLLGACGELAPKYQYVAETDVADRHGRQLAHAALATLYDMEPPGQELVFAGTVESGAPLAVWTPRCYEVSTVVKTSVVSAELPLKEWPSAEELEQQRQACDDRAQEERLRRKRDIRRTLGDGATYALPIYAWRLGDAILIGCCCEAYSVLQQELRGRYPNRTIVCMNLINGTIGYLPPADLYGSDLYQVWQTPFARGGLERVIETMDSAIGDLLN